MAFIRGFQGPGEIEVQAQGIRGTPDGGLLGLPDFIFGVAEAGEPIQGNIIEAVKHGDAMKEEYTQKILILFHGISSVQYGTL